jgi:hypothetical protein
VKNSSNTPNALLMKDNFDAKQGLFFNFSLKDELPIFSYIV